MPNGTVEKGVVDSINGAVIQLIQLQEPMEQLRLALLLTPNTNSVWILENTTLQTTQWRVVNVTEDKDNYAIVHGL